MEKLNFEVHPLHNCFFLVRNQQDPKQLDGILGCHVDDGIGGGNERYEAALNKLQEVLPFGSRGYGKVRLTGLDLEELPDLSIKINKGKYIEKVPSLRPLPFRELTFASFGDASFASESNLKAQQVWFVMACTPQLAENQASDFSPIAWFTKQLGRVVRSTLSAEAYAMLSSIDKL